MKKTNLLIVLFFVLSLGISNAQVYTAKTNSSILEWTGKKVTGEHYGTIELKSGEFTMADNKIKAGKFIIDMTTIVCKDLEDEGYNKKLVGHLMSDDFFGTASFPIAYFVINSSSQQENGSYTVYGDLTIKGITHPLEFKVTQEKTNDGIKLVGKAVVDRTKYNIQYGSGRFYEKLGDNMIYDDFILEFKVLASI